VYGAIYEFMGIYIRFGPTNPQIPFLVRALDDS